jgi:uncharacterized protein (TIGR03437 family)
LALPSGVAVDSADNLYIADTANNRIREVSNGVITTIAAGLFGPQGVAVDSAGNIYIADSYNCRIRKVSNGVITTVAGSTCGFSGIGGPATSAEFGSPFGVAVDSAGNLYIALGSQILEVSNGVITTVAGNGTLGFSGDGGPATSAELYGPEAIAVDAAGNIYIADSGNYRVRKASNGVITTIAGNGTQGFSGDGGPATSAELVNPEGVAIDSAGHVYVADGNRVRLLTPNAASSPCTYSVSPTSAEAPAAGGSFSISVQTTGSCFWNVTGLTQWVTVSGASSGKGSGSVALVVAPNISATSLNVTISVAGVSVAITQPSEPGTAQPPSISLMQTAGQFGSFNSIAPGTWIEIYGNNLAPSILDWSNAFNGINAPASLNGTMVTIGGQAAFLDYVSPTQVNAQVPSNLTSGPQEIMVVTGAGTSAPYLAPTATQPGLWAPQFLNIGGTQYVGATLPDYTTYILPTGAVAGITSRPAHPGETIYLFGIGFGPVTPNIPAGQIEQQDNSLSLPMQVMFGQTPATLTYEGLAPNFIGLYLFKVTVPNVPSSDNVPLTFTLGGMSGAQMLYTAVQD